MGILTPMMFQLFPATASELALRSLSHHLYPGAETRGLLFIDVSQMAVEPSPRQDTLRTYLYSAGRRHMVD